MKNLVTYLVTVLYITVGINANNDEVITTLQNNSVELPCQSGSVGIRCDWTKSNLVDGGADVFITSDSKNKQDLPLESGARVTLHDDFQKGDCSLTIINPQIAENGNFTCVIQGSKRFRKLITLAVESQPKPPYFAYLNKRVEGNSILLESEQKIILKCVIEDSFPLPQVTWDFKPETEIDFYGNGSSGSILKKWESTVQFGVDKKSTPARTRVVCTARQKHYPNGQMDVTVFVGYPSLTKNVKIIGGQVTNGLTPLSCDADGFPFTNEYKWYHKNDADTFKSLNQFRDLQNITVREIGVYKCEAKNVNDPKFIESESVVVDGKNTPTAPKEPNFAISSHHQDFFAKLVLMFCMTILFGRSN